MTVPAERPFALHQCFSYHDNLVDDGALPKDGFLATLIQA